MSSIDDRSKVIGPTIFRDHPERMEGCQLQVPQITGKNSRGSVRFLSPLALIQLLTFKIWEMLIAALIIITASTEAHLQEYPGVARESENSSIFGDPVVVTTKKSEDHIRSPATRIREDELKRFQMSNLIVKGEGRRRSRKSSVPILKIKSAALGPIFAAIAALFAFKGFWAGMTALFVSKAIALKVFTQSKSKCVHDSGDHDDYEDHDQYHERRNPQKFPRDIPYFRNHEHASHGENHKPTPVYSNANGQNYDSAYGFLRPPPTARDPELPETWNTDRQDPETRTWEDFPPSWD